MSKLETNIVEHIQAREFATSSTVRVFWLNQPLAPLSPFSFEDDFLKMLLLAPGGSRPAEILECVLINIFCNYTGSESCLCTPTLFSTHLWFYVVCYFFRLTSP